MPNSAAQNRATPAADAPIAIIGMSCLFPDAPGLKEYWRLLRRGEDAIREVPETHWRLSDYLDDDPQATDMLYCGRGGFLGPTDFDPLAFGVPPAILEATDTAQLLGLVCGKRALEDAGYGAGREFDRARAGVILGVTGAQELVVPLGARLGHPQWRRALARHGIAPHVADEVVRDISSAYVGWQENSFPGLLGNVVAGRIANRLNLHGTNCVVDAACASSLGAVHMAAMELATGRADLVLTGGADTFNDIFMFMCFARTQALSRSGDARPFAADADGTVLGEGVGLLVLKRLADAQRDGDRVYAVIRGIGTSSDGRSQSIYAPRAEGQARALREAYARGGVSPATVGLVEAHGTGTRVGDVVEFEALRTVFEEAGATPAACALGSVKSQIGHTKAAAGAASLIKAVLALHHGVLPPTIKITEPNPKLDVASSPFHLVTAARPWLAPPGHPRRAAVSAFGFGGSNFHVVVEEYPAAEAAPAWDGSVEIVALSADTAGGLTDRLDECQRACSDAAALARLAAESRRVFRGDAPLRLALVLERGKDAAALLSTARAGLRENGIEGAWSMGDVFFAGAQEPGELALLFPGQGSQYVNMCRDVVCVFPEARRAVEALEEPLRQRIYPPPTHDSDQRRRQEVELARTEAAQPALGAVSLGLLRVLSRFGIRPHFVAGHSFGELVALHAAGCLDEAALQELARERGALLAEADDGQGAMLAVSAPLDELEACLATAQVDGQVVLANRNAPRQGVVSGPRAAIESLRRLFDLKGWRSSVLQVSAAFHSSFMAPAYERFRAKLERLTFEPPKIPVLANATGQPYTLDPAGVRELLADQLTRPVHFLDEIRHLYQAGVRTFVEVGPRNVLTGLVRSILHDLPHHAIAADMSCGRSCGIADIARVLALVAVLGHAVDLKAWESEPPPLENPSMTVQILGANYRAPAAAVHPQPAVPRDNRRLAMSYDDSTQARAAAPASAAPAADRDILRHATNGEANGHGRTGPPAACCEAQARPNAADGETGAVPLPGDVLQQALLVAQQGLRGMQALQQQTAAAHQQFLETQQQAQASFARLVEAHQRLMERAAGAPVAPPSAEVPLPARPDQHSASPRVFESPVVPRGARAQRAGVDAATPVPIGPVVDPVRASLTPSVPPSGSGRTAISALIEHSPESAAGGREAPRALLEVVAELTGYPVETLRLDMDIEADLGIDSIKRLEILSTLQRRLPGLSAIDSQQVGALRTLGDIVRHALPEAGSPASPASPVCGASAAPSEAPRAHASGAGAQAADALLAVVAELTGYPAETLRLDMDIEADLGIDSIKRLEILSTLQRRVPGLSAVDSQELGGLRTLGDMLLQLGREKSAPQKAAAGAPAPACGAGSNGEGASRRRARTHAQPAAAARPAENAPRAGCSRAAPGMTVAFERRIDPARHAFLSSHVIAGRPVLPVVMMLEWLAHGALHANPGLCVASIDGLRVLKGLIFEPEVAPAATVLVSAAERRGEGFAVRAELLSAGPRGERLHARAEVLLAERLSAPPPAAGAPADLVWRPRDQAAHEAARAYRDTLFHGPLLAAIREVLGAGCGGMVATVRAAPPPAHWMDDPPRDQWIADPLALDGGLQLGLLWCQQFAGLAALPSCVERVTLHAAAPWPEALTVTLNVRESDAARLLADLEFSASAGVVATVSGCEWTLSSAVSRGRAAKESRQRRDDADSVSLVEAV